jgi:2-oxoglutarate ferredoxin oxidoreductase subunit alpha
MFSLLRMEMDPALSAKLRSVRHFNGLPIDARSVTDEIVEQEGVHRPEFADARA